MLDLLKHCRLQIWDIGPQVGSQGLDGYFTVRITLVILKTVQSIFKEDALSLKQGVSFCHLSSDPETDIGHCSMERHLTLGNSPKLFNLLLGTDKHQVAIRSRYRVWGIFSLFFVSQSLVQLCY